MATSVSDTTLARPQGFDPDRFFTHRGRPTLVGPADLDAAVPPTEQPYLDEVERYWLDQPNAFAVISHSRRENQYRYVAVEPHLTDRERTLLAFLAEQCRMEIDYEGIARKSAVGSPN